MENEQKGNKLKENIILIEKVKIFLPELETNVKYFNNT